MYIKSTKCHIIMGCSIQNFWLTIIEIDKLQERWTAKNRNKIQMVDIKLLRITTVRKISRKERRGENHNNERIHPTAIPQY